VVSITHVPNIEDLQCRYKILHAILDDACYREIDQQLETDWATIERQILILDMAVNGTMNLKYLAPDSLQVSVEKESSIETLWFVVQELPFLASVLLGYILRPFVKPFLKYKRDFKSVEQVPPALMYRIITALVKRDMLRRDLIETPERLIDFWLFAIRQGWPHPEMRECIADWMFIVAEQSGVAYARHDGEYQGAYSALIECKIMGKNIGASMKLHNMTQKEYYDFVWKNFETEVKKLKNNRSNTIIKSV
jgi:hypothetical protein